MRVVATEVAERLLAQSRAFAKGPDPTLNNRSRASTARGSDDTPTEMDVLAWA